MNLHIYCDGGIIGCNPSIHGGTWAYVFVDADDVARCPTCGYIRTDNAVYGDHRLCKGIIPLRPAERMVSQRSGLVTPADVGLARITNNLTELLAAVEALEAAPRLWSGTLFTDSSVTRVRLQYAKAKMNGIPATIQERLASARKNVGQFKVVQLHGHPTKRQLCEGTGKHGWPVSKWNVLCDKLCGKEASKFAEGVRA